MLFRSLRCSFCRRRDSEVNKLVAGPRVYICDRCAYETIRIMETEPPAQPKAQRPSVWTRLFHPGRAKVFLRTSSATSI
jgi:ATP-dependent Clp protease ATP-binding subunit ClpX